MLAETIGNWLIGAGAAVLIYSAFSQPRRKPAEAPLEPQAITLPEAPPEPPPAPTVAEPVLSHRITLPAGVPLRVMSRFGVPHAVAGVIDFHGDPEWMSTERDERGRIVFRPDVNLAFTHVTVEYDTGERRRYMLDRIRLIKAGDAWNFLANVIWTGS